MQQQRLREYYTFQSTLGRKGASSPEGTGEFFAETERQRYSLYPYLPELMEFDRHRGHRVLEIGTGEGVDHTMFARAGSEMYGIDLTPHHIAMTRERLKFMGLHSELSVADATNLPFQSGMFDLVYSCGVLFLIPDIEKAVREIYRVLKPRGRAIALFYNRHSFQYYVNIHIWQGIVTGGLQYLTLDKLRDWYAGDGFGYPHVRYFSRSELKSLFLKQGFGWFDSVTTALTPDQLPLLSKFMTEGMMNTLSRYFGYYLTVKVTK